MGPAHVLVGMTSPLLFIWNGFDFSLQTGRKGNGVWGDGVGGMAAVAKPTGKPQLLLGQLLLTSHVLLRHRDHLDGKVAEHMLHHLLGLGL